MILHCAVCGVSVNVKARNTKIVLDARARTRGSCSPLRPGIVAKKNLKNSVQIAQDWYHDRLDSFLINRGRRN